MLPQGISNEPWFILMGSYRTTLARDWNTVMKKLLATAALVTLIAAPALAQQPRHQHAHRAQVAQTAQYGRAEARPHSANRANDVYDSAGKYVGSDPDVRVRQDILRDAGPAD